MCDTTVDKIFILLIEFLYNMEHMCYEYDMDMVVFAYSAIDKIKSLCV